MSLTAGVSVRRFVAVLIVFMAGIAAVWITPMPAAQAKGSKVTLSITTKSQASLLKSKRLSVAVRSTARTSIRVVGYVGSNPKLLRPRTVRFGKPGKKSISLGLTLAGRTRLATCGAKKVRVLGRYRNRGKKVRTSRTRTLSKDQTRCGPAPVTVPLGDNPERCDFLDSTVCLQPFPNDYYTKTDPSTPTKKRLDIKSEATPSNIEGVHVDTTDINRADGFSPGSSIELKVPGLDTPAAFQNSGLVPLSNLHVYDDPDQSVIVIDADTGQRQPIWAELDSNPTTVDPTVGNDGGINQNPTNTKDVNLYVRPAKNFLYGHRYIVAFRNLKSADNTPIDSPLGFRVYRDNLKTNQDLVEARRPHMESVIDDVVDKAGLDRSSLYMAWDFTIASQESVTGRALQIRDAAFAEYGDTNLGDRKIQGTSPSVTVTAVCNQGDPSSCGSGPGKGLGVPQASSGMLRYVEGTLNDIPCFLNANGCPSGSTFDFNPDGSVDFDPAFTMNIPFRCIIPEAVQPGGPGTAVVPGPTGVYGHGLLGDYKQIDSAGPINVSKTSGGVWCGANWDGFSSNDLLPAIAPSLSDISNFNKAVDRMQQGFVNFMLLQRAMIHPGGFSAQAAFQLDPDGPGGSDPVPVIDTSQGPDTRGQYMGISQGGIMGGSLVALSPDSDYGVLGAPGMNYSTLLQRSVDSDQYFKLPNLGLYANYPDQAERPVLLSLMQLLWDRGEANGYAQAMTSSPLPNTPPHNVLLSVAFGDHQVTNYSAEVEARTIGASIYSPALNTGRHWDEDPFLGMNEQTAFPWDGGSMMVYYDSGPPSFTGTSSIGIATPPLGNVPPRGQWGFGGDPHEHPRRSVDGYTQASTFLQDGTINSCATTTPEPGDPTDAHCYANGWTGP